MASELKLWKYEIKYGPDGEDSYSWVYDDQGVMVAPMRTHKAKEVVDRMNTRPAPAATDTGLVTIGYGSPGSLQMVMDGQMDHASVTSTSGGVFTEPVCFRSQVEELLAVERANTETALGQRNMTIAELARLEADNAAKDARIEKLEDRLEFDPGGGDRIDALESALEFSRHGRECIEAKLAAAEKALEPFVSFFNEAMKGFTEGYAERTPSDKPVLGWNNAYLLMRHFIKARAVLGGKPS